MDSDLAMALLPVQIDGFISCPRQHCVALDNTHRAAFGGLAFKTREGLERPLKKSTRWVCVRVLWAAILGFGKHTQFFGAKSSPPTRRYTHRGGSRGTTNSGMYVDLDLAAFGDINNRQKREPPFSTSTSEEPGKTCNCTRDTHMARVLSLLAVVAVDTHTHHNETAFKTKHSGTAREGDSERQAPSGFDFIF